MVPGTEAAAAVAFLSTGDYGQGHLATTIGALNAA